ncbi:hypothetical protein RWE15_16305 [Virgibacillus halophilus]|uniref:NADPH2:quinone reductase n=1 Tax=Tigheibacillus halophilus TaxID=361280 RepID=A0ABU5CAV1_9BACI|nr:hypothetical protein [Virgibacillus halophilus]
MDTIRMRKVARIYEYGSPQVIQVEDQPVPIPLQGEVLVRMKLASVNFFGYPNAQRRSR